MRNNRLLLWLVVLIAFISIIIDLPKNYRLQFTLGPLKVDRIISSPSLNIKLGSITIKNDFITHFGLDLSGGTHLVLEANMDGISSSDKDRAFASAKNVVERRINLYG